MTFAYLHLRTWLSSRLPARDDERGASLVEYALLLVLVAVAMIIAVRFLGSQTSGGLSNAGSHVGASN